MSGVNTNQPKAFPERYVELKKKITQGHEEAIIASWKSLLSELATRTKVFAEKGSDMVPQVEFSSLSTLSQEEIDKIKHIGSVVIRNVVDDDEAVGYRESLKDYVKANPHVAGFPEGNKQFFEMYWSSSQLRARSHPNVLASGVFCNKLYNATEDDVIDLSTNLSYADRFRIRHPSKNAWNAHQPHVDGASVERWEDDEMRSSFADILRGDWKHHDPYALTGRLKGNSNLYGRPNQTSMFRSFQGWLAMSNTGPGEGTLCVFPDLHLSNSYIILRPFFRPVNASLIGDAYLDVSNWVFDTSDPSIPGINISDQGHFSGLRISNESHPHLRLDTSMVSIPRVSPGDLMFWHCDVVHSVEQYHHGPDDSSVMYIPAVPVTPKNVKYLARHRDQFLKGLPPPDFPQSEHGESQFDKKGTEAEISVPLGRVAMGLDPLPLHPGATKGAEQAVKESNAILAGVA